MLSERRLTPAEQEQIFSWAKHRFHKWPSMKLSGYVHGVEHAYRLHSVLMSMIFRFRRRDPYAQGYLYGYVDAYGSDVLSIIIKNSLNLSVIKADFRWWEKWLDGTDTDDEPGKQ